MDHTWVLDTKIDWPTDAVRNITSVSIFIYKLRRSAGLGWHDILSVFYKSWFRQLKVNMEGYTT
jgi:hypothetical protein